MRAVAVVLVLAACGPSLPSASTETDGGASSTGTSGASASTTSGGASTGEASTAATGEPTSTTGAAGSTTEAAGSTTEAAGSTTDASTGAAETGATTGEALPSCCVVPDAANADVVGTTPLGPIALTWAWFGIYGGECGGRGMYVYEDPSLVGTELGPQLQIFVDDLVEMPGTFPVWFTVIDAQGKQEAVEGMIDVSATDAAHEPWWCAPGDPVVMTDATVELSFSIVAEGWDVTGEVTAVYCPQLSVFCP